MQLDLLSSFDRASTRNNRIVDELVQSILNYKFLRIHTTHTALKERDKIVEVWDTILGETAKLAFKRSQGLERRRGVIVPTIDYYTRLTINRPDVMVTEYREPEDMREMYNNAHRRIKTLLSAHKDLLTNSEKQIGYTILDSFDLIHTLSHVV